MLKEFQRLQNSSDVQVLLDRRWRHFEQLDYLEGVAPLISYPDRAAYHKIRDGCIEFNGALESVMRDTCDMFGKLARQKTPNCDGIGLETYMCEGRCR